MTPARQTIGALLAWVLLALAAAIWPPLFAAWVGAGAGLATALLADGLLTRRVPRTTVERILNGTLALGVDTPATLRIRNESRTTKRLLVHESPPASFTVRDLPRTIRIQPQGWIEVPYSLRATRRGSYYFTPLRYRQLSPFRFWWQTIQTVGAHSVRVYPNFRAVARFALMATSHRTAELGIRKRRRRGEGTEFHQLREYRDGDPLRQIDWRATSRLMKMVSREYRDERDQQLMFLLDCGRRMHARDGDLSHLDHALNAILLLAFVALRQGDAVGLQTFGGQDRQVPPRKGASYLTTILNAVFDLATTTAASDISLAMEEVLKGLRRRSLIVVVTNLRDERDEEMTQVLRLAGRRNLVLLASLREVVLAETLNRFPTDFDHALRIAATHDFLRARRAAHERLARSGVLSLDIEPRILATSLVNRYLRIKSSGEL